MKLLLLTRYAIGQKITARLLAEYPDDLIAVVTTEADGAFHLAQDAGVPAFIFTDEKTLLEQLVQADIRPDLGLTFWWPYIVKKMLRTFPRRGFINTHPALLPFDAGSMSNFWTLAADTPYGVSLHIMDDDIDSGPIIAQRKIDKTWEDTDETLYHRSLAALEELFFESWPLIRQLRFSISDQKKKGGSFHTLEDTQKAAEIFLDRKYTARKLLNLLRARSYEGTPGCFFHDHGERYELRIKIRKIDSSPKA